MYLYIIYIYSYVRNKSDFLNYNSYTCRICISYNLKWKLQLMIILCYVLLYKIFKFKIYIFK